MIMRIYRCSVVAGMEAEFREFAFSNRHPWLREKSGLNAFYAGRPMPNTEDRTRCMVEFWDTSEAIEAALGPDWHQTPPLPEEARAFIESASVEHYEIADQFRTDLQPHTVT